MTPKLAEIFTNIRCFAKGGSRLGRLPPPLAVRTVVEGLIWPFPWHLDALLPSVALEHMTIGLLTQALVAIFVRHDRAQFVDPGLALRRHEPELGQMRPQGVDDLGRWRISTSRVRRCIN